MSISPRTSKRCPGRSCNGAGERRPKYHQRAPPAGRSPGGRGQGRSQRRGRPPRGPQPAPRHPTAASAARRGPGRAARAVRQGPGLGIPAGSRSLSKRRLLLSRALPPPCPRSRGFHPPQLLRAERSAAPELLRAEEGGWSPQSPLKISFILLAQEIIPSLSPPSLPARPGVPRADSSKVGQGSARGRPSRRPLLICPVPSGSRCAGCDRRARRRGGGGAALPGPAEGSGPLRASPTASAGRVPPLPRGLSQLRPGSSEVAGAMPACTAVYPVRVQTGQGAIGRGSPASESLRPVPPQTREGLSHPSFPTRPKGVL